MKLQLNFDNPTHRLVQTIVITLSVDGVVKAPALSAPGSRTYDISDQAASVSIEAVIPDPTRIGPDLLHATQLFSVTNPSGRLQLLVPSSPISPRFTSATMAVASGAQVAVAAVKLDLRFIDLTAYASQLPLLLNPAVPPDGIPLSEPLVFAPAYNAKFVALECTDTYPERVGSAGLHFDQYVTWAVLVPPNVWQSAPSDLANALLFIRPNLSAGNGYYNTDNVAHIAKEYFERYVVDPPSAHPFFVQPPFEPYPNCGFERQLVDSRKPVVLFFPLPHLQGHGKHGSVIGPNMPDLVRSALIALFESGLAPNPKLGKLALSGFSAGGGIALQILAQTGARVDELYLFEPVNFKDKAEEVKAWFIVGGKKLRMLAGGYQHQAMIALANRLKDPNATVTPDDEKFWYNDPLYKRALSSFSNAAGNLEHFDPVGPGKVVTADSASRSNMFLQPGNTGVGLMGLNALTWVDPNSQTSMSAQFKLTVLTQDGGRQSVAYPSQEEAASLVRWGGLSGPFTNSVDPFLKVVTSSADFLKAVSDIQQGDPSHEPDRIGSIRHQWTVVGGQGTPDRQAGFKGHLQLCLEKAF